MSFFARKLLLCLVFAAVGCASGTSEHSTQGRDSKSGKITGTQIIRVSYSEKEIAELCDASLHQLNKDVESVQSGRELEDALAEAYDRTQPAIFMAYVHGNSKIRDEASDCETKYNQAMVDIFTRRAPYAALTSSQGKSKEESRLYSELKRQFEKNGLGLADEKLAKVKELKTKLAKLEADFSKNLNEDKSSIAVTVDELKGVSEDYLNNLKKDASGKYVATTKTPSFLEVMQKCSVSETRKKMLAAYDNRAASNTDLLEQAVQLRRQIAKVMGFKNWADYRIDGRMAQNSKKVMDLLEDLKKKLRPRLEADLAILLKAKQEMEDPKAKKLEPWDLRYYEYQVKKRDYSLDDEVVRQYFPKDTVLAGVFEVYSTLLGVKYEEVTDAAVWSPEVKLYAIREKSNDRLVGYFYTDFIPREGKYGHAAAFTLITGRVLKDSSYSHPVSAIVANFTPPSKGKPSLFTHDEVETLFHEFGHIMHQTLTKAPYATISGSNVAQDFVEAPSQMLENWVWNSDMLKKISGLYNNPSRKLPDDLIAQMLKAKDFNQGYYYSRQLMLGLTDMAMHLPSRTNRPNVTNIYRKTHTETLTVPPIEGSHFLAGFGHMMGGYDAGYYGYIWSEVFAADMFTVFQKAGLLDTTNGRRYRQYILEEGNLREPYQLLTDFIGREPNNEAFLKKLGL